MFLLQIIHCVQLHWNYPGLILYVLAQHNWLVGFYGMSTFVGYLIVDFDALVDPTVKILKKSDQRDNYLDLARELRKLWNMRMMVIPVMIGALGTVFKCSERGLEVLEIGRQIETILTTALLRLCRILRRVLETRGDLLSLTLQ